MTSTLPVAGAGPLLLFGGPYSNFEATLAMRGVAERLSIPPERVICTGDVVAYCAAPEETVQLIRDWGCHVIKGNCEVSLAERAPDCGCGFEDGTICDRLAKGWYSFADELISDASRGWMRTLPSSLTFTLAGQRLCAIHGGVSEINRFIFASTPASDKRAELESAEADIMIAGHCGIPFMEKLGSKVWVNPGVIGMPANDGTRDGWYGLIEQDGADLTFSIHRLAYNAEAAARQMHERDGAKPYAEALVTGLWPSLDVLPPDERAQTGNALESCEMVIKTATRRDARSSDGQPKPFQHC